MTLTLTRPFDGAQFKMAVPGVPGLMKQQLIIAASDEITPLIVGTNRVTFRMPFALALTAVRINVNTAPTGASLIVDVKKNGTTIFSTKVSIDAGEKTSVTAAVPAVLSTTALADDDEMTVDVTQIGSGTAGQGLKLLLIGNQTS